MSCHKRFYRLTLAGSPISRKFSLRPRNRLKCLHVAGGMRHIWEHRTVWNARIPAAIHPSPTLGPSLTLTMPLTLPRTSWAAPSLSLFNTPVERGGVAGNGMHPDSVLLSHWQRKGLTCDTAQSSSTCARHSTCQQAYAEHTGHYQTPSPSWHCTVNIATRDSSTAFRNV